MQQFILQMYENLQDIKFGCEVICVRTYYGIELGFAQLLLDLVDQQ